MTATAVLLLDIQNEFVHPDGKLHHEVADMMKNTNLIANISDFVDEARRNAALVVHSPVIMSKKRGVRFGEDEDFDPRSYGQMHEQHGLFDEGSWNAEFAEGVTILPDDPVLFGRRDFSAFQGTNFEQILREHKIERLFISGFLTNICVLETAIDASELGFLHQIVVLSDGCATYNEDLHKHTIDTTLALFCDSATVKEAKKQMAKSDPVQQRRGRQKLELSETRNLPRDRSSPAPAVVDANAMRRSTLLVNARIRRRNSILEKKVMRRSTLMRNVLEKVHRESGAGEQLSYSLPIHEEETKVSTLVQTPFGEVLQVFDRENFASASAEAKASQKYGACVTIFSPDQLNDCGARMFMSNNEGAFAAVTSSGEVINVVRHRSQSESQDFKAVMTAAVCAGANFLECMDTITVPVYQQCGFVPVARVAWDDRFAPFDWDKNLFSKYNKGEPYYTYMVLGEDTKDRGNCVKTGPMPTYDRSAVRIMSSDEADKLQISSVVKWHKNTPKKVAGAVDLMNRYVLMAAAATM